MFYFHMIRENTAVAMKILNTLKAIQYSNQGSFNTTIMTNSSRNIGLGLTLK